MGHGGGNRDLHRWQRLLWLAVGGGGIIKLNVWVRQREIIAFSSCHRDEDLLLR